MTDFTTNEPTNEIPYGYCACGCGEKTNIARVTDPKKGWVKGEPLRYRFGHKGKKTMEPINPSGKCLCGCGEDAPIAERTNYVLGHTKGQPVRFILGHQNKNRKFHPAEDRFWTKVNRNGPIHPRLGTACWDWTAGGDQHGYGQIFVGRDVYPQRMKAHRFSYELEYGPIPEGLDCLHHCDRPSCVNPAHLYAGTAKENTADSIERGRASKPPTNNVKGEHNGHAQFTDAEVIALREEFDASGMKVAPFARKHGVAMVTMWNIVRRKTWKHLP